MRLIAGTIGGIALAAVASIGFGGVAGAQPNTVTVPVPPVVTAVVTLNNVANELQDVDCVALVPDASPTLPIGVCVEPFGFSGLEIDITAAGVTNSFYPELLLPSRSNPL